MDDRETIADLKRQLNERQRRLTMPELCHLFNLVAANEEEGSYSGNKAQYWARHKRVKTWLEAYAQQISRPEPLANAKS